MVITMAFAGGFTGGYFASRGDPFWTISGGLAGVIGVSAGADVYAPTLAYLLSMLTAVLVVYAGGWIERRRASTTRSARSPCTACAGFLGMLWVGIFAAGYPTGINNVESLDRRPAHGHGDVPAARLPAAATARRGCSSRLNLLRVPPEVELEGLDIAEYGTLVYPEHGAWPSRWSSRTARSWRPRRSLAADAHDGARRAGRAVSGMLTLLVASSSCSPSSAPA